QVDDTTRAHGRAVRPRSERRHLARDLMAGDDGAAVAVGLPVRAAEGTGINSYQQLSFLRARNRRLHDVHPLAAHESRSQHARHSITVLALPYGGAAVRGP